MIIKFKKANSWLLSDFFWFFQFNPNTVVYEWWCYSLATRMVCEIKKRLNSKTFDFNVVRINFTDWEEYSWPSRRTATDYGRCCCSMQLQLRRCHWLYMLLWRMELQTIADLTLCLIGCCRLNKSQSTSLHSIAARRFDCSLPVWVRIYIRKRREWIWVCNLSTSHLSM